MGNAKLPGGAPLVGFMTMPLEQLNFMDGVREAIIWWGIPLTILAGIATHLTSRRSVARQREMNIDAAANPQTAIMNKLMLYMFPLFVVVGGPFFPLAILFYWLANNSWTFGQLKVAHTLQDRKALAKAQVVEEVKDLSKFSTPKPGAKPKSVSGRPVVEPSKIVDSNGSGGVARVGWQRVGQRGSEPHQERNVRDRRPKAKPRWFESRPPVLDPRTEEEELRSALSSGAGAFTAGSGEAPDRWPIASSTGGREASRPSARRRSAMPLHEMEIQ